MRHLVGGKPTVYIWLIQLESVSYNHDDDYDNYVRDGDPPLRLLKSAGWSTRAKYLLTEMKDEEGWRTKKKKTKV